MIIPIFLIGVSLAFLVYVLIAPSVRKNSIALEKTRRFYFCALIATDTFLLLFLNRYMSFVWTLGILFLFTIVTGVIFRKQYKK